MNESLALGAEVAARCLERGLLLPGERVLVAVSSGADSTALALLLAEAPRHGLALDLVLAHVDHGWRGAEEARADRTAVDGLADRLGLRLVAFEAPVEAVPSEDAARRWRYRCLERAALDTACPKVATGHHLRDQAETVLMRLERGSGAVGLRGIPPRRPLGTHGVEVVRPLLDVHPDRLRAWLTRHGATWREDPTNLDLTRDRAHARARLLAWEARGKHVSSRLADLAERLGRRVARQEARVTARLDPALLLHPTAAAVEVPRALLGSLSLAELDLALRRMGRSLAAERDGPWFTRRHLKRIHDLLASGGAIDLPRGLAFDVSTRRTWLRYRDPESRGRPPLAQVKLVREDQGREAFDLGAFLASRKRWTAAVDASRLGRHARLRLLEADDTFLPFGRAARRRVNVERWLKRRGVPRWLRRAQPVVIGAAGVAWLPGHRIDGDHAVHAQTERVARLRLVPAADSVVSRES